MEERLWIGDGGRGMAADGEENRIRMTERDVRQATQGTLSFLERETLILERIQRSLVR